VENVAFDYSKLRGRITEKFGINKEFAKAIKVSPTSLSLKLNNRRYFDQAEIYRASEVLDIEPGAVSSYFFCKRLKKT